MNKKDRMKENAIDFLNSEMLREFKEYISSICKEFNALAVKINEEYMKQKVREPCSAPEI